MLRGAAHWEPELDPADPRGPWVSAAQARLRGALPQGFSYALQGEVAPRVRVMDAWIQWSFKRAFKVRLGHHRPFVSEGMLQPLSQLSTVHRPLVVRRLAPMWDWGLSIGGRAGVFFWDVGLHEGGWLKGALPQLSGRSGLFFDGRHRVKVSMAGLATRDAGVQWAGGPFFGRRALLAICAQWDHQRVGIRGEIISAVYDPEVARTDFPAGGHVTALWRATKYGSLVTRVEAYSRTFTPGFQYDLVVGGSLTPLADDRPPVQAQLNYRVPLHRRRLDDHALELSLQLWL